MKSVLNALSVFATFNKYVINKVISELTCSYCQWISPLKPHVLIVESPVTNGSQDKERRRQFDYPVCQLWFSVGPPPRPPLWGRRLPDSTSPVNHDLR